MAHAQVNDQPAHQRAQAIAQAHAAHCGPQHIDRPPAPAIRAEFVQAQQPEPEHHQRKRRAVVQPAFAGQAKTQAVPVAGVRHLHVRRQHRVGGGQNGAQQHSSAQRQIQGIDTNGGDGPHCQQHRHRGQLHRNTPARIAQRQFKLHAAVEQRQQHGHLGHALQQGGVFKSVQCDQVPAQGSYRHTQRQVQHGGTERQARQKRAGQCHAHQQHAGNQASDGEQVWRYQWHERWACWLGMEAVMIMPTRLAHMPCPIILNGRDVLSASAPGVRLTSNRRK